MNLTQQQPNYVQNVQGKYSLPTVDDYNIAIGKADGPSQFAKGSENSIYNSLVNQGLVSGPNPAKDLSLSPQGGGGMGGGGGYSGGGGGGMGGGGLADQQKALIAQRRKNLITGAGERYQGELDAYGRSEDLFRDETGRNKEFVGQQRDLAVQEGNRQADDATRMARQNYMDSIVQNRRRMRATGAGSSSASVEMFNLLDRDFSTGLNGIEGQRMGIIGNAQNVAQKAMGDLEASLNKFVADIQNQRELSLRQKNEAVRDAEFAAADAALKVDQWLASRMSSGGGGGGSRTEGSNRQANVIARFAQDLQNNPQRREEVMQAYGPIFAKNGINPQHAMQYGSFGQPQQPSFLQEYTGLEGASDKDIQFLMNYGNQQQSAGRGIMDAWDPYTGNINPLAQIVYPDQYSQLQQLANQGRPQF
jgi:hypothetical protein